MRKILRPLSSFEKSCFHVGDVVLCTEGQGTLALKVLHQACERVANRHPLLAATIAFDETGRSYFAKAATVQMPLEVIRPTEAEFDRQATLNYLLQQKNDLATGTFRAFVIVEGQQFRFYTLISHMLIDGRSNLALHDEIFADYERLRQGDEVALAPYACPPSMDEAVANTLAQLALDKAAQHDLSEQLQDWQEAPGSLALSADFSEVDHYDHSMQVVQKLLDAAQTSALVAEAKREAITVQALLELKMMQAIAQYVGKADETVQVNMQVPIDVRGLLRPVMADDRVVLAAASLARTYTVNQANTWLAVARQMIVDLSQAKANGLLLWSIHQKSQAAETVRLPKSLSLRDVPWHFSAATLPISNVGLIHSRATVGGLRLQAKYFAVTGFSGKPFFNVSTFQDQLVLDFLYSPQVYKSETMSDVLSLANF